MDGSNDFHPETAPRPSDPSLEEMLRRARAARLGGDDEATMGHPAPVPPVLVPEHRWAPSARRPGVIMFLAGMGVGLVLACLLTLAGALAGHPPLAGPTAPRVLTAPTATLSPTATATPPPTATPVPTATATPIPTATAIPTPTAPPPPTTAALVALVQDFYDHRSLVTGRYLLRAVTALQIQSQDGRQLAVCIAYEAAAVTAPDTIVASNIRLFTLVAASDGSWQAVRMGESNSCSLN